MGEDKLMYYCVNCNKEIWPILHFKPMTSEVNGLKFNYIELYATCPECGEEVYLKDINDSNVLSRQNGYYAQKWNELIKRSVKE